MALSRASLLATLLVSSSLIFAAFAHDHDEKDHDDDHDDSHKSTDVLLVLHICIQLLAWIILFPLGATLGLSRSMKHVPLQAFTFGLTLVGQYLGHHHGSARFYLTLHAVMASWIVNYLYLQVAIGTFLKLHVWEGTRFRKVFQVVHSWFGKGFIVVAWFQILLGGVATSRSCFGHEAYGCWMHGLSGSALVAYGVGSVKLKSMVKRMGLNVETFDSFVWLAVGVVALGTSWPHISYAALWTVAGLLGLIIGHFVSSPNDVGRVQLPNVVPGIVLVFTGWAVGSDSELTSTPFESMVHTTTSYLLMSSGLVKILCLFLNRDDDDDDSNPIDHLAPLILTCAGVSVLSSNSEQLHFIFNSVKMDHISYLLLQCSVACLIYLWSEILSLTYQNSGQQRHSRDGGSKSWTRSSNRQSTSTTLNDGEQQQQSGLDYEILPLVNTSTFTPTKRQYVKLDQEDDLPHHVIGDDDDDDDDDDEGSPNSQRTCVDQGIQDAKEIIRV